MTALTEYQRLEGAGIWHASPEEQRRDVALSLGDATLTISTFQGAPLSHWSLPALHRINPGEDPAMYAPGEESAEVLEVTDEDMVAALEKVRRSVARRQPKPGRVRWSLIGAAALITLLAGYIWLPQALIRQAAAVVPEAVRTDIGESLLTEFTRFSGAPCETSHGTDALGALKDRLFADWPGKIVVLPGGARTSAVLPGDIIVLNHDLVEDFDTPDVVAGYILMEAVRSGLDDPLKAMLAETGAGEAARLMVTGKVRPVAITERAETLALEKTEAIPASYLVPVFRAARVSLAPLARAIDPTGESTLSLIEADPYPLGTPEPLIRDSDWIALQGICEG